MRERLCLTTHHQRCARLGVGRQNEVAADRAIQVVSNFEDIFTAAAREIPTLSKIHFFQCPVGSDSIM